jgi:antagonist of KipI
MSLSVLDAGLLTTIQDAGRFGFERFGVPVSGAMDWFALQAANRLVGNPSSAAALEFLAQGPTLRAEQNCLVAAAGPGFALEVDGRHFPLWLSVSVRAGSILRLVELPEAIWGSPVWGYLAVSGGVDVPPVMGSRATYLRGGFGGFQGRALQNGDVLPIGRLENEPGAWSQWAGRDIPPARRPAYASDAPLRVIPGPQLEAFPPEAWRIFLQSEYRLGHNSDRMGYRLEGPALTHRSGADILSDGIALGAVQVPGSGQPMILLSDRQTTGGYTKIATLIRADLPRLVQRAPGSSGIRFAEIGIAEAQQAYRTLAAGLQPEGEDEALLWV